LQTNKIPEDEIYPNLKLEVKYKRTSGYGCKYEIRYYQVPIMFNKEDFDDAGYLNCGNHHYFKFDNKKNKNADYCIKKVKLIKPQRNKLE